jgi:hypothetical protein
LPPLRSVEMGIVMPSVTRAGLPSLSNPLAPLSKAATRSNYPSAQLNRKSYNPPGFMRHTVLLNEFKLWAKGLD